MSSYPQDKILSCPRHQPTPQQSTMNVLGSRTLALVALVAVVSTEERVKRQDPSTRTPLSGASGRIMVTILDGTRPAWQDRFLAVNTTPGHDQEVNGTSATPANTTRGAATNGTLPQPGVATNMDMDMEEPHEEEQLMPESGESFDVTEEADLTTESEETLGESTSISTIFTEGYTDITTQTQNSRNGTERVLAINKDSPKLINMSIVNRPFPAGMATGTSGGFATPSATNTDNSPKLTGYVAPVMPPIFGTNNGAGFAAPVMPEIPSFTGYSAPVVPVVYQASNPSGYAAPVISAAYGTPNWTGYGIPAIPATHGTPNWTKDVASVIPSVYKTGYNAPNMSGDNKAPAWTGYAAPSAPHAKSSAGDGHNATTYIRYETPVARAAVSRETIDNIRDYAEITRGIQSLVLNPSGKPTKEKFGLLDRTAGLLLKKIVGTTPPSTTKSTMTTRRPTTTARRLQSTPRRRLHATRRPLHTRNRYTKAPPTTATPANGVCGKETSPRIMITETMTHPNRILAVFSEADTAIAQDTKVICCDGYQLNGTDTCVPVCGRCNGGKCVAPANCSCPDGKVLDLGGNCVRTCPQGCPNGRCSKMNRGLCFCNRGYSLKGKLCVPVCRGGCPNGNCTAPGVCSCLQGYRRDANGVCIPTCRDGCQNADCVAPDTCECHDGYVSRGGDYPNECEPHCPGGCGMGACTSRGVCTCLESSVKDAHGRCVSLCKPACINSDCVGPNKCVCRLGFAPSGRNHSCVPVLD